jgi:hypothetical protein
MSESSAMPSAVEAPASAAADGAVTTVRTAREEELLFYHNSGTLGREMTRWLRRKATDRTASAYQILMNINGRKDEVGNELNMTFVDLKKIVIGDPDHFTVLTSNDDDIYKMMIRASEPSSDSKPHRPHRHSHRHSRADARTA